MSYAIESAKVGHIPTVFIELDIDFCALRSGVGACTATETGDDKCYNTYSTCNDPENFDKTIKTYRFCDRNAAIPVGINAIPLVKTVSFASQEITPNKGLGVRGSVRTSFIDAPWPDTEIDPYFEERSYKSDEQGTFWGKFKARNPYYENRILRVRRGYLTPIFDWDNFVNSVYIIDQFIGISKNDDVTIVAKDLLKLADDKKALFPKPSNGRLSADISNTDTSFTLVPSGVGAEYKTSGKLAISGEVVVYSRSGDTFTVTRGASNTTAEAHTVGDTVQEVGIFNGEKIQDVIYELLTTYSGISTDYIDKDAWDDESTAYLAGVWNAEITEPTGINTLIGELTEQGLCRVWWDELEQQIPFRAVKPLPDGLPVLTDESHFLSKTIDVKTDTTQRIATVLIYFAQKKPTEKIDDLKNYELRVATPDLDAISALQYGTNPFKKIYSRWFKKTSLGRVNALADSLIKTYRDPPQQIEFSLTPAFQLKVGDLFYAQTRKMQDVTGAIATVPMEVVYAQPTDKDDIKYKAQQVSTAIPIGNIKNLPIGDFTDLNLYDFYVDNFGIPEIGIVANFEILSGSLISASSTSVFGLVVDGRWPADVTLNLAIYGFVAGLGGNGGDGARIEFISPIDATDGTNGGPAIDATGHEINIDNQGTITGGQGGSGAGGSAFATTISTADVVLGGGGSGGWPNGLGGLAAIRGFPDTPGSITHDGFDGNDAGNNIDSTTVIGGYQGTGIVYGDFSVLLAGNGGNTSISSPSGDDGGDGTAAGAFAGFTTHGYTNGSVGGQRGDAIHGNSNVNWINSGTIHGDIV